MRSMKRLILPVVLALVCWGSAYGGMRRRSAQNGNVLLIVPARYAVVQAAFDMARLRSIYLASYSESAGDNSWSLHVWDSDAGKWLRISLSEFSSGSVFLSTPRAVVLVGSDSDIPKGLTEALFWAPKIERVRTMLVADLVNQLNPHLRFTPSEWRWMAKRYQFELTDRNAERRRYGRYGRPNAPKPLPPAGEETSLNAPMPPVTESRDLTPVPVKLEPSRNVGVKKPAGTAPMPGKSMSEPTIREKAEILKKSLPEVTVLSAGKAPAPEDK